MSEQRARHTQMAALQTALTKHRPITYTNLSILQVLRCSLDKLGVLGDGFNHQAVCMWGGALQVRDGRWVQQRSGSRSDAPTAPPSSRQHTANCTTAHRPASHLA